jgi:hypothetical protein
LFLNFILYHLLSLNACTIEQSLIERYLYTLEQVPWVPHRPAAVFIEHHCWTGIRICQECVKNSYEFLITCVTNTYKYFTHLWENRSEPPFKKIRIPHLLVTYSYMRNSHSSHMWHILKYENSCGFTQHSVLLCTYRKMCPIVFSQKFLKQCNHSSTSWLFF